MSCHFLLGPLVKLQRTARQHRTDTPRELGFSLNPEEVQTVKSKLSIKWNGQVWLWSIADSKHTFCFVITEDCHWSMNVNLNLFAIQLSLRANELRTSASLQIQSFRDFWNPELCFPESYKSGDWNLNTVSKLHQILKSSSSNWMDWTKFFWQNWGSNPNFLISFQPLRVYSHHPHRTSAVMPLEFTEPVKFVEYNF